MHFKRPVDNEDSESSNNRLASVSANGSVGRVMDIPVLPTQHRL